MRTIIASILFFSFFSYNSNAQQNDFQLWNTLNLSKKINKSFRADIKYGARFRENASLLSTQFIDFKVKYKENKRWSFAIGYRSISDYSISNNFESKNRFYADAYFSKKLKRYFFSLRNRVLTQLSNNISKEVLRQKYKLAYNIKKTKLSPSISMEFFYSLENYFYKIRNSFELAYPINKKIDFSLVYKIENEFNVVDPFTLFIFEPKISYKL
jgi:hypothetical protein